MFWKSLFRSQNRTTRRRRQQTTVPTEALEDRLLLTADIEWTFHRTADGASPSPQEQQLLWLINDARSNPAAAGDFLADTNLTEIASDRAAFGVDLDTLRSEFNNLEARQPLTFDARLYTAARAHADDLIARDAEDDTNQISRITDAGFDFSDANGSVNAFATSALNAYAAATIDWANEIDGVEPGRPDRANQLSIDTEFTNVGFAVVQENDPSTNVGPLVVAQNFAIATDTATDHFNQFITGTVWDDLNDNGIYDIGEGLSGVRVTPDAGDFFAITSEGGGYSIPVIDPGDYNLTFSNGISAMKSVTVDTVSELVDVERGSLTSTPELASEQFSLLTTSATSGGNASFRWELVNNGTADAGPFTVEFFLSLDGQSDPEDFRVLQVEIDSLAGNGGSTGAMDSTFTLPGPTDPFWSGDGEYQLLMEIDSQRTVTESDETNNSVVASNTLTVSGTSSAAADLTGGSVSTVATTAAAGSAVNYTWVVANNGDSATGEFAVDFYISEDGSFDPNDRLLGRQTVDSLAANSTTGGRSVALSLPATGDSFWAGDGAYFIVMDIDPGFSVDESNETNNFVTSSSSLAVTNTGTALAELVGSALTISPSTAIAGDEISLQWQVNNTGSSSSGNFIVDFYISQDSSNDPTDVLVGSASVASIGANGNSGLRTTSVNLPPGLDSFWVGDGAYRILLEVDPQLAVAESNENNNFFPSTNSVDVSGTDQNTNPFSLDIDGDGRFDSLTDGLLVLRHLAGFTGTNLTNGVISQGATRTTPAEISTYLDDNADMLDADGNNTTEVLSDGILILRYFAGFTGPSLVSSAVGANATRTTGPQVSAFLDGFRPSAGPVASAVPRPIAMTTPDERPDLTSTQLEVVAPLAVDAGDTVSVNWDSSNIGDANATAYQVSFFLSNDDASDPADLLLTTTTQTFLAAGANTGTLTTSFTLPELNDSYYTGDGNYWIVMLLDDGNSLIEHDETNNLRIVSEPLLISNTVPAQAELSAGVFRSASTAAAAGTEIDFDWEVQNTGNLAANNFRVNFFLSTDDRFNPGDELIDFEENISIEANGTTGVLTRTVSLPNPGDIFWQGDGDYQLLIVVDPTNAADEANERNNISTAANSISISNTIASRADLTGGTVEPITTNVAAGDTVQVNRNILNTGAIDSGSFNVNYYLSQDGSFGPGDELIGSETITNIATAGSTGTSQISVTLPDSGEPFWNGDGEYTILAILDVGPDAGPSVEGEVDEVDEDNNTIVATNLLTVENTGGGTLDIDDSNSVGALTDGLLAVRYLAGFTGSALVNNAVSPDANRNSDEIFSFLESFRPNLDVDDNGTENAISDGILVLRYITGFRGDALVNGAVDLTGGRTSATEIEAYLATLMPAL